MSGIVATSNNQTHLSVPSGSFIGQCASYQADQPEHLYVNLSTFWYSFLAFITTVGLLVSSVSNLIIIYLFTITPALRKNPSNIIAVNLSLSDMLYCIQWPSVIYCCLSQSTWILEYDFVCKGLGFITVSTALVSIVTVMVMSLERAIVVKHPIHAKNKLTIKRAWLIIVSIWLACLASSVPPLFGTMNQYTLDPSKTSCTLDYLSIHSDYKLYIMILYIAYYIVPMIAITISYIIIISTFNKSSLSLKEVQSNSEPDILEQTNQNHNTSCSSTSTTSAIASRARKFKDSIRLNLSCTTNAFKRPTLNNPYRSANNAILNMEQLKLARDGKSNFDMIRRASLSALNSKGFRPTGPSKINGSKLFVRDHSSIKRTSTVLNILTNFKDLQEKEAQAISKLNQNSSPISCPCQSDVQQTQAAKSQKNRNALQFRLAKMSFYLILLWLVSWSPIAWLAMLNSLSKCRRASATAVFLASTMTKLGPAFDVFIYGLSHPKLKSKFRLIIKRLFMLGR